MASIDRDLKLIIDLHYFPSITYYKTLIGFNILRFEQYEHYVKGSFRNRCQVAGPDGPILLSIPLVRGRNQRTQMKDVRICNTGKWQALHWKTLGSAYRSSPWFEYYEDELHPFFEKQYLFLMDWNLELFGLVNRWLGLSWETNLTGSYEKSYDPLEFTDYRNGLPGGYAGEGQTVYTQVFGDRTGFLPGLSILDLVFCEGKKAAGLLGAVPTSDRPGMEDRPKKNPGP